MFIIHFLYYGLSDGIRDVSLSFSTRFLCCCYCLDNFSCSRMSTMTTMRRNATFYVVQLHISLTENFSKQLQRGNYKQTLNKMKLTKVFAIFCHIHVPISFSLRCFSSLYRLTVDGLLLHCFYGSFVPINEKMCITLQRNV